MVVQSLTPEQKTKIIKLITDDLKGQGASSVNYGIRTICDCTRDEVRDHVTDKVLGALLESGEYTYREMERHYHGYDFSVFKNPTFEFNQSIVSNSRIQKNTTIFVAVFTGVALCVSAANFWITFSKPQQNLLQVSPNMRLLLDSTLQAQKGIDSSLRKAVKDSFYRK